MMAMTKRLNQEARPDQILIRLGRNFVMKTWFTVALASLFMVGAVSSAFAAAGVEYGIIISKPAPGSGLGNALNKKLGKLTENSNVPTKQDQNVRKSNQGHISSSAEGKPINLIPAAGGAVDPETGIFYNEEGGGYYNPETTTFVIK